VNDGNVPQVGWGSEAFNPPYTPVFDCQVMSFDTQTGAYVVFSEWSNEPTLAGDGFIGTAGMVVSATNVAGDNMPLVDQSNDLVVTAAADPWTGYNDQAGDFLGDLTNPNDQVSGGTYMFYVGAWTWPTGDLAPTTIATAACTVSSNGVTPVGSTVCPGGPGTCANPSVCTIITDTATLSFPFLFGTISMGTISFPDPMSVPGWVTCEAEQVGEWAVYPTEGVIDSWQSFGSDAHTHVPAAYLYDGVSWVFSFTNQLHTDIPSDYVGSGSACMQVTPDSLPNGHGGSTAVTPAELCGNGTTSLTGDQQVVGSDADLVTLLSVLLLLGFALGLIAIAGHLLRGGAK
jgi:hypothetical protein